ncbi:MAG: S41 family peptidase [Polyangiales bacterium]
MCYSDRPNQPLLLLLLLCAAMAACGDDVEPSDAGAFLDAPLDIGATNPDAEAQDAGVDTGAPADCDPGVAVDCASDTQQRICVTVGDEQFIQQRACAEESSCLHGTCATAEQLEGAAQIRTYIQQVKDTSGHPFDEDYVALEEEALRVLLSESSVETGIIRGAVRFALSYQQGHQSLTFSRGDDSLCGDADSYAYTAQTFYAGVCGSALGDEVLVMSAPPGNALGLSPGDVIVSTSAWPGGENFLSDVAGVASCLTRVGASSASERGEAAASFFGRIGEGMTLEVRDPAGAIRSVSVPPRETDIEAGEDYCLNPFGGYDFVEADFTLRPDGVSVIRVATLRPEGPWPDAATYYREVQNFLDRVGGALNLVPEGGPIIWDVRGNSGGAAEVALGIVAGMPGATTTEFSRAFWRIDETDPPEWETEPESQQSFTMRVEDDLVTNHRDHAVAVLVNSQTLSAGDVFAYAAKNFTDALLVGPEGTSGIFGFGGRPFVTVEGTTLDLNHRVDPFRVVTPSGEPLERASVEPDMVVPYLPEDVAAGRDTVVEAAAAALLR